MSDQQIEEPTCPLRSISEFQQGCPRLHHIPGDAKVLMPASIERSVWECFSGKAEQKGIELSDLLTEVLKRDMEIGEALK